MAICDCDETGSWMGCAGCDVSVGHKYDPTPEEMDAAEQEFHQMARDEYYASMHEVAEFDG